MNQPRIKSKEELKAYFRNGMIPDETRFADLIDAFVHHDEFQQQARPDPLPVPQPAPLPSPPPPAPAAPPAPPPGWVSAVGRFGAFRPGLGQAPLPPVDSLEPGTVPADGERYPIISDLVGCHAFEIVASASGASDGRCHAVMHAVVVLSMQRHRERGIRQTCSYMGWDWRRRIRLRWNQSYGNYELCIGTGTDFGMDDDGNPALIRYHITRLW